MTLNNIPYNNVFLLFLTPHFLEKYVRVGKTGYFGKVKTYQSNNALKKSQKPAGLWDFI